MRNVAQCITLVSAALLFSQGATAVDYTGYLTVNDEDYGYWEGQAMVLEDGQRTPLENLAGPITAPIAFETSHDLAQGLVRQFVQAAVQSTSEPGATMAEAADLAGSAAAISSEPPSGEGSWVRFGDFQTLGFGQYEGSDTSYGVYCDRNPSVWVWFAGDSVEGLSPDEAANLVLQDENGMARLRLGCDEAMEVTI